jgi:hypothetical protein
VRIRGVCLALIVREGSPETPSLLFDPALTSSPPPEHHDRHRPVAQLGHCPRLQGL